MSRRGERQGEGAAGEGGGRDWAGGRETRVAAVSQSRSVDLSDRSLAGLDGATWRGEKLPWVEGGSDGGTMASKRHGRQRNDVGRAA